MATANLSAKGQITLPKEIRKYLHVQLGAVDVKGLKGILLCPKRPISLAAMENAIRKRERFKRKNTNRSYYE